MLDNFERTDRIAMRAEPKRTTKYDELKTLVYIKSQVGPAYSRIVKQKRRAEVLQNAARTY